MELISYQQTFKADDIRLMTISLSLTLRPPFLCVDFFACREAENAEEQILITLHKLKSPKTINNIVQLLLSAKSKRMLH